ncbi:trypsin-like peptidase domain-containing protein [Pinibacter aurantiacus]|uniref:Trypsin-like peptidase domain-containing protein n=1 Tax=Pinibacter aurantiacus TaxID=2851599 RepID=A0A9E2W803_9BACT|nr:trypsin-like peptidase domain-containing protein [Pinibacter aurantiacus]MBV4357601.1 trypsin-like peptidase domain-containing protein [Pinibacter aurantiacus]
MFANACSIAREFTFPIIISHRTSNGKCSAGIGTFVVINEDGWFITAFHIMEQLNKLGSANGEFKALLQKRLAIENDTSLKKHVKIQQLNSQKIPPDSITDYSVWLGWQGLAIEENFFAIPNCDIAVGKLKNFDKSKVKTYPKFKNPNDPMEQGTSLCKLGFPFHSIEPTFDEQKGFILPPGSLPIPIFPIDGIYTRTVDIENNGIKPYPLMFIETSTPGLRGQSGGPTFDVNGTIWAIQSQTHHLKLGFGDNQKNSKEVEHLKNQYLNVGWGTHSITITSFLKEINVSFQTH